MWIWLGDHPEILSDFAQRAYEIRPYVSSAIVFGVQKGVLLSSPGALRSGSINRGFKSISPTADLEACVHGAEFMGKWLGKWGTDETTILARWGVRP